MTIKKYHGDRKKYLSLLLEADPCEEMLDRYLSNGFFLTAQADGDTAGVACIVPVENVHNGVGGWELKNISVAPRFQRQGVGSALIAAAEGCLPKGTPFWVGTADGSVAALAFYFVKQANKSKEEVPVTRSYTTHDSSQPRKYDPAEIKDRDSRRRLEQLDSFLRNGVIDKKEYAVLRARYQREASE